VIQRGDIVLIDFPFTDTAASKIRPALVIQNDEDNSRLLKTIVALLTGNLKRASEPTHLLIDPNSTEGVGSGLHGVSLVSCINLYTVEIASILRSLGHLSEQTMSRVDSCLRAALELS